MLVIANDKGKMTILQISCLFKAMETPKKRLNFVVRPRMVQTVRRKHSSR